MFLRLSLPEAPQEKNYDFRLTVIKKVNLICLKAQ